MTLEPIAPDLHESPATAGIQTRPALVSGIAAEVVAT
jgi:hypothetical protein